MVDLCNGIVDQIKRAKDDTHIKLILEGVIHNLPSKERKGPRARRMLIVNLIMALRYEKTEELTEGVTAKITIAIKHLEMMHKLEPYNLF